MGCNETIQATHSHVQAAVGRKLVHVFGCQQAAERSGISWPGPQASGAVGSRGAHLSDTDTEQRTQRREGLVATWWRTRRCGGHRR